MRAKSGAFGAVLAVGFLPAPAGRISLLSEPRAAPTAPQQWGGGRHRFGARLALRAKSGAFGAVCVVGT